MNNVRSLWDSIVRTLTPIIVGAVLGWITTAGINLDPEFEGALTLVVGAAFAGLWHLAARVLETYVSPRFGWLLGLAKQPDYDAPSRDQILAEHALLSPGEQEADIQAALSRRNQ